MLESLTVEIVEYPNLVEPKYLLKMTLVVYVLLLSRGWERGRVEFFFVWSPTYGTSLATEPNCNSPGNDRFQPVVWASKHRKKSFQCRQYNFLPI